MTRIEKTDNDQCAMSYQLGNIGARLDNIDETMKYVRDTLDHLKIKVYTVSGIVAFGVSFISLIVGLVLERAFK